MKNDIHIFAQLLDDITRDAKNLEIFQKRLHDFVILLAKRGVLHRVNALVAEYQTIVRAREQKSHVLVRSAHELEPNERASFQALFHDHVDLEFVVDSQLLHGVQVQIQDTLIDSSLAGRLHRLSQSLQYPVS